MTGHIKSISNPKLKLEILSQDEISRLHTATLDIIENVGVKFPSLRALEIWEAHGAQVDRQSF
ncbi:MAG TPA: trimethylamine methyltransferase family protein, partial [Anaerolineales bacterium]|nr:trimethylamine methyltransferase family protein [Anaerolineales bacterium]